MKKIITVLLVICFVYVSKAGEIQELRNLFYASVENEDASNKLFEKLKSVTQNSSAITIGYKGMSYLIQAKHAFNPYTKFTYFTKGTKWMDKAIEKDKTNIELRFFRLSVQENAPKFLGYYEQISEDKKIILNALEQLKDKDLQTKIKDYLQLKTGRYEE